MQKAINNIIFMNTPCSIQPTPAPKKTWLHYRIPAWQWFIGTGRMVGHD
jgi:hypothetical protein